MKKRVVLLRSGSVNPDPPVEKVSAKLVESGFSVTVLAWDRDNAYASKEDVLRFSHGSAKIVRFGIPAVYSGGIKKNLLPLIRFEMSLFHWLSKNRNEYDILHAFDMDTGLVAEKAAKMFQKKLVYHILDFYADSHFTEKSFLRDIIKKIEFSVINAADAVIICSEKRRCQIEGSKPKYLEVIHNTPDFATLREKAMDKATSSERMRIAYAGILISDRLLRELVVCVMADERFELRIAGFGELEEYIKECAQKCDRILYRGKLPYSEVLAMENESDIMTALYVPNIPNHRYAAPNKLYEAMMLGKPVIMCRNTGWDEIIERENIGVLAEPNQEGVRDALCALYARKDQWPEMSEKGKKLYQSEYSWDIMKKRLDKIYRLFSEEGETP